MVILTFLFRTVDPPVTTLMILRAAEGYHVRPVRTIPYRLIPQYVKTSVVFLEDHDFWHHHGIAPGALKEAWQADLEAGKLERGGSTITQQLARTLFLYPHRTFLRKILEAGTSLILESILDKRRILELYLNEIEWGPGVFGIEAGARYQFGTGVRKLSDDQQARLLAIITNPLVFSVKNFAHNRGMAARYWALIEGP